ncbi:hypothetical protein [Mycobacterium xenopi]|uniref:Uncharacterized protein n=1 Tax=Mycobacterium xenopi TaxID=1789 RepID=A0AAD1H1V6_MYCXE|nr:hypothetical protein [Mycobacterium xenopi]EID17147.1 hypothetical protein MXEN_01754 [Mycobacterium xenopi RIVM700367]MDA3639836.1 hypothetical protein [Mycobacterium xenopi]MDA3658196.1 hypothetical protein [Mycobacterium xenopi]MDA3661848.1 hypothetical protein [Mycobacterium xenopi]ORX21434.1 hypothetical protein AWC32_23275 [Mycobacterium xenopi]
MTPTHAPPSFWLDDQFRAWRLVAASGDHDGILFDSIVAEAVAAGRVEELLAALARNMFIRLRLEIGAENLDALIAAELAAVATERERDAGQ